MRVVDHPGFLDELRSITEAEPLRVLVSGCLAGLPVGVEGTDYGLGEVHPDLFALPTVRTFAFCPEDHALGTPRTMPDIHGGDGAAVLLGRARVRDPDGNDLSAAMIAGGRAMVAHAKMVDAEVCILTDMSAACGTQVISDGCRVVEQHLRRYQRGVGVAAALLIEAGFPVVAQRDFATVARLRAKLDPDFVVPEGLCDWHETDWYVEYFRT